ncbi:FAD-dependent monooxygenase [Massilia sp. METH4]|uniref:FAD-dependent monooxygenase n=1 Tax=Massilia sp. METH4 TaxID=3123041 RepID=UPI0030CAD95D
MEQIGQFRYTKFATTLPDLVDGRDSKRHRIVICGGGPVGMVTALGLARHGIASTIVEADDSVCVGSRAACVSRRSLEIIEQLGVLKPFLDKALPWTGGRSYYRTKEVFQFEMPHDANQKLPPMVNLQQYYIEQFLLDEIGKYAGLIEVRWASRVSKLDRRADGCTITVVNVLGEYQMEADWLIATDGGQSFVRNALDLKLKGIAYEGKYVIADIEMQSDAPAERRAWFDPPSNPGSTMLMHRQPDNVWRIDYQVPDNVDPEEAIREENVLPIVEKHLAMLGERQPWKPVWLSIYRAGAMTLDSYWHGRVLFAGNAAHVVPIFGVRGLNSGIDDAYNLAWKLAFVVKGLAPQELLATYSEERVQAFHENISYATKSTEFMAPPSRGYQLMREAALSLAEKHPVLCSLLNPRQTSPIVYQDSHLNTPADPREDFAGGPAPGAVLLECPIRLASAPDAPAYLTDLLSEGFTILDFSTDGSMHAGVAAALEQLGSDGIPVQVCIATRTPDARTDVRATHCALDHTGNLFDLYDGEPGTVYLVRPDGHIAGRWRNVGAEALQTAVYRALAKI